MGSQKAGLGAWVWGFWVKGCTIAKWLVIPVRFKPRAVKPEVVCACRVCVCEIGRDTHRFMQECVNCMRIACSVVQALLSFGEAECTHRGRREEGSEGVREKKRERGAKRLTKCGGYRDESLVCYCHQPKIDNRLEHRLRLGCRV